MEKNNVSKKIKVFSELTDNLLKDFKNPKKEEGEISSIINNLGQKTLTDTMYNINNFLFNETK